MNFKSFKLEPRNSIRFRASNGKQIEIISWSSFDLEFKSLKPFKIYSFKSLAINYFSSTIKFILWTINLNFYLLYFPFII